MPFAPPPFSKSYLEALKLVDKPDSGSNLAFSLLKEASEEGDVRAIYAISTWYNHGRKGAVRKNRKTGMRLLKSIRHTNIAEAKFDLAVCYDSGIYVRRNSYTAFRLYTEAALLGDVQACEQVAEFYRSGEIVRQSGVIADAWMQRSECKEADISQPYRVWLRPQVDR